MINSVQHRINALTDQVAQLHRSQREIYQIGVEIAELNRMVREDTAPKHFITARLTDMAARILEETK